MSHGTIAVAQSKVSGSVAVNSADSGDFTGNFTIPYQDKECTNQTGFFTVVLFLRTPW